MPSWWPGPGDKPVATLFTPQGPNPIALIEKILAHPNVVACWPMDEASGSILDRSTLRLTGTVTGSPTYGVALGKGFRGVTLAAAPSFSFGDVSALAFERTSPFSILVLLNPNISAAGSIINKLNSAGYPGWRLDFTAAGLLYLDLRNSAGRCMTQSNAAPANGTLTLLGATYSGSSTVAGIILYKDGATYADTDQVDTLSAGTIIDTSPAQIGAIGAGILLNASLGLVAVFNAVLTAREMRDFAHIAGFV